MTRPVALLRGDHNQSRSINRGRETSLLATAIPMCAAGQFEPRVAMFGIHPDGQGHTWNRIGSKLEGDSRSLTVWHEGTTMEPQ